MILDATIITHWQSCRRRAILDHDWRVIKWRPKSLLDAVLRSAIVVLSSGADPIKTASEAKATYLQAAADPGLDIVAGGNPYQIAKDYCAMLDTVIRSLARTTLHALKDVPPVQINADTTWRVLSHQDDSGQLHRWITTDHWNENDIPREAHSWYVLGDMAACHAPMMLHIVSIGRMYKGRRASPWTRAFQHPGLPRTRLRFKRQDKSNKLHRDTFKGWRPTYLADNPRYDIENWVERMWQEGAAQDHLHQLLVNQPSEAICEAIRQDMVAEGHALRDTLGAGTGYAALPMARAACDGILPCPFQDVCYSEVLVQIENLGLYQARENRYATVT